MTLHLLNTTIIPAGPGRFFVTVESIDVEEARRLLARGPWQSHVGHDSTASLMSAALGVVVPMDRTPMSLPGEGEPTVECLVMQVAGRPPEGRILTREELEALGVTWRYMRIDRSR